AAQVTRVHTCDLPILVNIENLTGSNYNDTLEGNAGNNVLAGGSGTDTVTYVNASAAVTVNLANTGAQNTIGAGTDTLTGFENLKIGRASCRERVETTV